MSRLLNLSAGFTALVLSIQLSHAQESVEEVVVEGVRFNYTDLNTALKVPLTILETPQTVLALTSDVLDFAGIEAFQDVYKVDPTGDTSHRNDAVVVNYFRGFRQDDGYNALKVDGFRLTGANLDFAPFERLELTKGATSTMFGQNSVAGTLNAISKMPKDVFGGEIKMAGGSYDHYRVDVDVFGPLTRDRELTYRFVAARLQEGSFLDYAGNDTTVLAPTLKYEIGESTALVVRVNYQDIDLVPHWAAGLQYLGDIDEAFVSGFDSTLLVHPRLPRSHFNGAAWNTSESEHLLTQSTLDHRFGSGWTLRINAQHNDQSLLFQDFFAGFLQADGVPASAFIQRNDNDFRLSGGEVQLFGDIEAFGRSHTVFVGADYSTIDNPLLYTTRTVAAPSVYDPTFNTSVPRVTSMSDYDFFFGRRLTQRNGGITAQAFVRPTEALTIHLGGRYSDDVNTDKIRTAGSNDLFAAAEESAVRLETSEFTLQTGATYALTRGLNLYASYGETYEPQTGLIDENTFVDPERGVAKEVGIKGQTSERLSYSVALFDMERSNIEQPRIGTPFVDGVGTQRSRGIELEVQGTLLPGWELFASLGWMDVEFVDGELEGYRPGGAPEFGGSLFTSYQIQGGLLQGLGVGFGLVHKRGRETFLTPNGIDGDPIRFDFGSYAEVDLRLFHDIANWRLQVAATNVLNEKYYSPAPYNSLGSGVHVNPPRSVRGQAVYRF